MHVHQQTHSLEAYPKSASKSSVVHYQVDDGVASPVPSDNFRERPTNCPNNETSKRIYDVPATEQNFLIYVGRRIYIYI